VKKFRKPKKTALNLCLEGSSGSFSVKHQGNDEATLDVKYFLTHISLSPDDDSSETLLKSLAPFREMFDTADLQFDEILQRDIDDARVSSKLIPYVLDKRSSSLVKFFPPIVIVAIPTSTENTPANLYPDMYMNDRHQEDMHDIEADSWDVIRSGNVGSEVFQLDRPVYDNEAQDHDFVRFSVNTNRCKLVIVDGQHRAMALLALYRNLKSDWNDAQKKPYQGFYEEWDKDYIKQFDLSKVQMPAIICTVPDLHDEYKGDYDLKKASRSIFLTLNKSAQPVSESRNRLLDDSDLVSSFLRESLNQVKKTHSNIFSESSLKISNIELDQHTQQKISNCIAISSVSHLYYIFEHLLLNNATDLNGVSDRSGKFKSRRTNAFFDMALSRLNASDYLTQDQQKGINRNNFTTHVERKFIESFSSNYISRFLKIFHDLHVFTAHTNATYRLSEEIKNKGDIESLSLFFDGQNGLKNFQEHRRILSEKLDSNEGAPKLIEIVGNLNGKNNSLENWKSILQKIRAQRFIGIDNKKKSFKDEKTDEIHQTVINKVNDLYDNIITTVAFQAAITCTYFNIVEDLSLDSSEFSLNKDCSDSKSDKLLLDYVDSINGFFKVEKFRDFKKLVDIFIGSTQGSSASELTDPIAKSKQSFREIIAPNEMKPDSWPKYRYLILEMLVLSDNDAQLFINKEIDLCRQQIFKILLNRNKNAFSKEENIPSDKLTDSIVKKIHQSTFDQYKSFLDANFGKTIEISDFE